MTLYNRKEKIKKNCKNCNKIFEVLPSRSWRQFCSISCATSFGHKKGKIHCFAGWNKGKKMSKEWKEKLRQAKLNNPVRYWKNKKRLNLRKGKGKLPRNKLMQRMEYKKWRRGVFERDNFTCQKCGTKSEKGKQVYLEAHHIKGWAKFPKLRYKKSNGITYCKKCHEIVDKYRHCGKTLAVKILK